VDAAAPPQFFRLEFTVKEFEKATVANAKVYSTMLSNQPRDKASIRAWGKVSIPTPLPGGAGQKQVVFWDAGVSLELSEPALLGNERYSLNLGVEISTVSMSKDPTGELQPVIFKPSWRSLVIVPIRKNTLVFSLDDPTGDRKIQLELLVTPISN
jgi:hypothetical protein